MFPRTDSPELLDSDQGSADEVAASLKDLRDINRWLGGFSTHASLFRRVARSRNLTCISALEVAAGGGDSIFYARSALAREGVEVQPTLLDANATHLPSNENTVTADALALPFPDNSFDVVSSCLFIHHLSPEVLARCLRESLRVARIAVLVNDLRRSALHLAAAKAGSLIYRSPITAYDSVVSVRRAYTIAEFRMIAANATQTTIDIFRHRFFRFGAIVWKRL